MKDQRLFPSSFSFSCFIIGPHFRLCSPLKWFNGIFYSKGSSPPRHATVQQVSHYHCNDVSSPGSSFITTPAAAFVLASHRLWTRTNTWGASERGAAPLKPPLSSTARLCSNWIAVAKTPCTCFSSKILTLIMIPDHSTVRSAGLLHSSAAGYRSRNKVEYTLRFLFALHVQTQGYRWMYLLCPSWTIGGSVEQNALAAECKQALMDFSPLFWQHFQQHGGTFYFFTFHHSVCCDQILCSTNLRTAGTANGDATSLRLRVCHPQLYIGSAH